RLEAILRMTRAYPRDVALARTAADARAIRKSGRVAAFIGMENPYPLGTSVAEVPRWAAAGVSYIGITHFGHNQFGDSANPSKDLQDTDEKWGGLSPLGRELVAAINKAGVMVDVSHAGRKTTLQTVELSAAPVIASHSCVQTLADAPRNLSDVEIKAIAAKGGVVQITAVDFYVKPLTPAQTAARDKIRKEMKLETSEARDAMSAETAKAYKDRQDKEVYSLSPRGSVKDFVDHVDYVAKLVGVDHVGISSDFDGGGGIAGWEDASETANVTAELFRRGYSDEDVAKIWGGNLLRVLGEVQKIGARLRKDAGER
ncbi:MAG: dipeptidase, partial [Parvularculaceae bacterium]|nr:dipeptidase [Parvularculaceae bacterium]